MYFASLILYIKACESENISLVLSCFFFVWVKPNVLLRLTNLYVPKAETDIVHNIEKNVFKVYLWLQQVIHFTSKSDISNFGFQSNKQTNQ